MMVDRNDFAEADRMSEIIAGAIDECSDAELEKILMEQGIDFNAVARMGRDWAQRAIVSHGKARFAEAKTSVSLRVSVPRPSVSMDYDAMLAFVQGHIANDPHSPLTLAARNQSGALSVDELKSLVEDIESLKA